MNACRLLIVMAITVCAVSATRAAEIVVKNDSMTDAASVTQCTCFISPEIPAAWLTSPVDGNIVAVQIFWESMFGGQPDSTELSIQIFDDGTFPVPGALLQNDTGDDAKVVGPTLTDGILNEFRFLDPLSGTQSIAMRVPVSAGQTFVVGLEFLNDNSGQSTKPSVAYDSDGCQAGKNSVRVGDVTPTWSDFCSLGPSLGDLVIRAVVEESEPIPTLSQWSAAAMVLLFLVAGTLLYRFSKHAASPMS